MSEAARCANTSRPLTRSTSTRPKEGLDVKPTPTQVHDANSPRWHGSPRQYQLEAQRTWSIARDRSVAPWSWITTDCEVPQCLVADCMSIHSPIRIGYRRDVCTYCGEGCGGVDHLLPEPWTGKAARHLVAVVPACRNCNSRINDHPSPNVSVRRRVAQLSIERHNKMLLLRPRKTDYELKQLGYAMRTVAVKNNIKAERVRARLAWPSDPFYDLRAFQKAGIDDPESIGLCDEFATPLRPEYQGREVS